MKKLITLVFMISVLNTSAPELSDKQKETQNTIKEYQRTYDELMDAEFSEENLIALLKLLQVKNIDIVLSQVRLETGWYQSRLFKNHNNLLGMGYARYRKAYSYEYVIADNGRDVASYRSWQSSVLDFVAYLDYYKKLGYDIDNYHKFLVDAGYCEKGSYYIDLLKQMM